ncbi:MAG: calcium/sodium antiporter [Acidimicrobiia bacterium]|nr:calcium/sodium antiporter [Acidimicrobiia bacterium]
MDTLTLVLFIAGFALLVIGAEALVRGASGLAGALGISPLVVGLTVVAFGTSAPEAAVTLQAAFAGRADLAVGNVVGSNIFNLLFVLGASALVVPLVVAQRLVRLEVPLMIGAGGLVLVLALDGGLGRLDGAILFAGILAYTVYAVRRGRRETAEVAAEYEREYGPLPRSTRRTLLDVALLLAGLGLLVLGARWLVDGAVEVATALGVSSLVIGLTIVAAGTGLPEVATSLVAAIRGERDIAVGNAVGSCLFNLLAVLGLGGLLAPEPVAVAPAVLRFDLPVMLGVSVACLPILFIGHNISRGEGALLFGYYAAYAAYLVLQAEGHDALPAFGRVMLLFVIPLTAVTLLILTWRFWRSRHPLGEPG